MKKETGQGMVEFAIVFPIFFMMLLFIIEISWVTYQRSIFDQGYIYSGWSVTAGDLNDGDPMEVIPSQSVYTGSIVADPIRNSVSQSSLWGFIPGNFSVTNAKAVLYNKQDEFDVPGRNPSDIVPAISRTRYMDLKAELSYQVYPLTFFGRQLFGNRITMRKELVCTRIVGSQHRSE